MKKGRGFDPTTLEIYRALYTSVAEEMGLTLRRTAHSPNIKERRDYSCAVFDRAGSVIAQGDHMPVHLGSMPMAVAAALGGAALEPGDVVVLNDRSEEHTSELQSRPYPVCRPLLEKKKT